MLKTGNKFVLFIVLIILLLGLFVFSNQNKKEIVLDTDIPNDQDTLVTDIPKEQDTKDEVIESKIKVTPLELVEDSRCPKGVQCIWAGTVKVKIEITNKNGQSSQGVLTLDEEREIAGIKVTLTEVLPEKTQEIIEFSKYKFKFVTEE
ncbi:hypothetical protein IT402_01965 [Candidatus Nomurabacteria bacterium]|nr:hypothetical protein [Candidatus Nomurabacteria bacterium]